MRQATLADIAKQAGVSISTVSLVLSGKGQKRCSPELVAQIEQIAVELGYRVNRLARGLRNQQSRTIGFLSIGVATSPYAGQLILAAQRAAQRKDYDLFFLEVENNPESIGAGLDSLAQHLVAGVIIAAYFHHDIELPENLPSALVLANCRSANASVNTFIPAEKDSINQILDEVGLKGHENVAFIVHDVDFPAARIREAAFHAAGKKYSWKNHSGRVFYTQDSSVDGGYEATLKLLEHDSEVTAVICYNDQLAMGAYQAVKQKGLQIPQDITITGFDDLQLISEGLRPGLSTVRLPHWEMGEMAVEKLIELCEGDDELSKATIEILGELVIRESISEPRQSILEFHEITTGSN